MSKARGKQPEFQKPPLPDFLRRLHQDQAVAEERPLPKYDAPGREDELPSIVDDAGVLTAEDERSLRIQHGLSADRPAHLDDTEATTDALEKRLRESKTKTQAATIVASFGKLKKKRAIQIEGDKGASIASSNEKEAEAVKPNRKRIAMSFE
ncbi:hypothetical protein BCR37DRAFT_385692 [Protomyces lactucae-debilis]|uniref:DUF4604 domain-containing protein n=1 Tax=Protomyces lactucae-debilis TaxID=2754530 RepID=A0A1Y2FU43_PROLT|nr:uncharacterized protein BCR37DRAFT_385692 [Protomyces lactucae-debilis]ORY86215.1 hypothetical protein BCR37DRAFT_385692 [Protomyces lactucae-debilis]